MDGIGTERFRDQFAGFEDLRLQHRDARIFTNDASVSDGISLACTGEVDDFDLDRRAALALPEHRIQRASHASIRERIRNGPMHHAVRIQELRPSDDPAPALSILRVVEAKADHVGKGVWRPRVLTHRP